MTEGHDEAIDQRQLAAYRTGDAAAGKVLYRRHFGRLRRFFANKACQPADVEDLVNRTFELLFSPSTKIAGAEQFTAYLFGIARNVWYRHLRAHMRDPWVGVPPASEPEQLERYMIEHGVSLRALGAGRTSLLERDEQLRKLLDALRELPAMYQELLELHYWEEMSFPQLAQVLGVPVGTAKSRLRLVKLKLYEVIEGRAPAGDERALGEVLAQVDGWAQAVARKIRRSISS